MRQAYFGQFLYVNYPGISSLEVNLTVIFSPIPSAKHDKHRCGYLDPFSELIKRMLTVSSPSYFEGPVALPKPAYSYWTQCILMDFKSIW